MRRPVHGRKYVSACLASIHPRSGSAKNIIATWKITRNIRTEISELSPIRDEPFFNFSLYRCPAGADGTNCGQINRRPQGCCGRGEIFRSGEDGTMAVVYGLKQLSAVGPNLTGQLAAWTFYTRWDVPTVRVDR